MIRAAQLLITSLGEGHFRPRASGRSGEGVPERVPRLQGCLLPVYSRLSTASSPQKVVGERTLNAQPLPSPLSTVLCGAVIGSASVMCYLCENWVRSQPRGHRLDGTQVSMIPSWHQKLPGLTDLKNNACCAGLHVQHGPHSYGLRRQGPLSAPMHEGGKVKQEAHTGGSHWRLATGAPWLGGSSF